jgi:hypothetical protein
LHSPEIIIAPFGDAVHVSPSKEYAKQLVKSGFLPPATHIDPFHATVAQYAGCAAPPKMAFPFVEAFQVIPSEEYANTFVPLPPATHLDPFHATEKQNTVNILFPFADEDQFIPSEEYANTFVPLPPATHIDPFHAMELQF